MGKSRRKKGICARETKKAVGNQFLVFPFSISPYKLQRPRMSLPRAPGLCFTVHVALNWARGPWIWTQIEFGGSRTRKGPAREIG